MKVLSRIVFFGLVLILVFFNIFQMLSFVLIRPFSLHAFRKFNSYTAHVWWGWCVSAIEMLHGTKVVVTGDQIPPHENAIVVLNHQSMADIPVLLAYAKRQGRLGDLKWFVKDVLKHIPGIGWGMIFLDCLFIKRNWTDDKDYITGVFAKVLRYKIPIWLISFVEGTRFTKSKGERSQKYAAEHNLPVLKHVLIPRTKGFVASVQGLTGHIDAVYDMTVGYVGKVPTMDGWVCGETKEAHLHVERIPLEQVTGAQTHDSNNEREISSWLMQRFQKKDARMEYFYQTGRMT